MPNNMDGVKISVNSEGKVVQEDEPAKKRGRRPAAPKAEAAGLPAAAKAEKRGKGQQGGLGQLMVSVGVTALVVGGIIYGWQHVVSSKKTEKISAEAQSAKQELEDRLQNLKDKLSGTEKEKADLENAKKELEEKAKLLETAQKKYESKDLGLSFFYPATFGEVSLEFVKAATGTGSMFLGKFSGNPNLVFAGVSADYGKATSSVRDYLLSLGFQDKDNKYFYRPAGEKDSPEHEIQPAKIVGFRGGEALILDKKSFVKQDEFSRKAGKPYIDIGENIGGLLNLKGAKYTGVAFLNSDLARLPLAGFEEMLKSAEVK